MEEKKLEDYRINDENLAEVAGGLPDVDLPYKIAEIHTCKCGKTPANIKGAYLSGPWSFRSGTFDVSPMCEDCAKEYVKRNYPDMVVKEWYYVNKPAK